MLVDDALRAVAVLREFDGPIVDVGSGGEIRNRRSSVGAPITPISTRLPPRSPPSLACRF